MQHSNYLHLCNQNPTGLTVPHTSNQGAHLHTKSERTAVTHRTTEVRLYLCIVCKYTRDYLVPVNRGFVCCSYLDYMNTLLKQSWLSKKKSSLFK